jgi:multiple sugar transport system substrate-binding protein
MGMKSAWHLLWLSLTPAAIAFMTPGDHTSADTKVTLVVEADDTLATAAMEESAKDFARETGIGVTIEKFGYTLSAKNAIADLSAKAGHYDVVIQNADGLVKFATEGSIYPIDDLERLTGKSADFEGDLYPAAWQNLSWWQGTRYGYPLAANSMIVVFRKDLLEKPAEKQAFQTRYGYALSVPKDWKEYRDIAEFFNRPAEGLYGTLVQGKHHPAIWFEWLNFAYSFGGGVMDKERSWEYGPIVINSPETVKGTEYYDSLKKYSPPGFTSFTWDDASEQMRDGHVFMCIMWSDATSSIEDPKRSTVAGKVGFAALPVGPGGPTAQIAGATYFVSRYARHPSEAFLFELSMMRKDRQIAQELAGGSSARKSVYLDPRVQATPYAPAMAQNLSVARAMIDTVPETPKISEIIESAISDVIADKKKVKPSLDQAAIELNKATNNKAPLKFAPATSR